MASWSECPRQVSDFRIHLEQRDSRSKSQWKATLAEADKANVANVVANEKPRSCVSIAGEFRVPVFHSANDLPGSLLAQDARLSGLGTSITSFLPTEE